MLNHETSEVEFKKTVGGLEIKHRNDPLKKERHPNFADKGTDLVSPTGWSKILVMTHERSILHAISSSLTESIAVLSAECIDELLGIIDSTEPDVVLLDTTIPGLSSGDVLPLIHALDRRLPVIFISAESNSETMIAAMQLGAYDTIAKPLDLKQLKIVVDRAIETRRLMSVPLAIDITDTGCPGDPFVGNSPSMLEVYKSIALVARQKVTVLVRGESGTGKELVARALYQHGDRCDQTFISVNCAALPDTLLESELFGHEKGAFTGADRRRVGKFEQCNGGTLFLDEIGDMSPLVQAKVLRVLQNQEFERVGGNETVTTNVRLIAATNRDLDSMVEEGLFRADLLYRLNGVTISLPPLRERMEDLPLLLKYFLKQASQDLDKPEIEGISPEALELLKKYTWPGNIRELLNVVRQTVLRTTGPVIITEFLPLEIRNHCPAVGNTELKIATFQEGIPGPDFRSFLESELMAGSTDLYGKSVELIERYLFNRVLQECGGNQSRAAEILGITRGKVRDRMAAFDIQLNTNVTIDTEPRRRTGTSPVSAGRVISRASCGL